MPNPDPAHPRPMLALTSAEGAAITLVQGRVHEICGPARRSLAAMLAQRTAGPVIWAHPGWSREALCPAGLAPLLDPARLILAACPAPLDLLWTAEEALRSGAVGAVVAELGEPPGLTPLRRLQLAAEAGGGRATGFLLTPGEGGAPGVESRWHAAPRPGGGWNLRRLRARMAPVAAFDLPPPPAGMAHKSRHPARAPAPGGGG
ncbi:MAG: ImuA family protein, partial [Gemmobacter sp.]